MTETSFNAIVQALHAANVRYLVVGGIAVNAHGYHRYTKDVDLVIELLPENARAAFDALLSIGYRPMVPVTSEQFADDATRDGWIRDKGMTVLQMWGDDHRETAVDLFVTMPFDFQTEYDAALVKPYRGIPVRVVSIPTLIDMKRVAGRKQDEADIEALTEIEKEHG